MKVLFFGDSITDAHRQILNPHDLGYGFVKLLSDQYPQIQFINRGISGHKTTDLLQRLQRDVVLENPDIVFLFVGINDAWHPHLHQYHFDFSYFSKQYKLLIKNLLHLKSLKHLYLVLPHVFKIHHIDQDTFDDIERVREEILKYANKYKLSYVSFDEKFKFAQKTLEPSKILVDGVHPTALGYELMYEVFVDFIENEKCLKEVEK